MFQFFEKQKYSVILSAFGFLLVIISYFDVADIAKLQISRTTNPAYPLYVLGITLILISICLYIFEEDSLARIFGESAIGWLTPRKVKKLKDGFSSTVNRSTIKVIFGRIDVIENNAEKSLIVLPANEFFDDECIKDRGSALGAFMQAKYPNQIDQVKQLIDNKLEGFSSMEVEKKAGKFQKSYGIGASIFLDQILSTKHKILLVSVTTMRAGEGLRAEMSYIFRAINETLSIVADQRLRSVYIPLIGSGHGGLKKEVSLFVMLLAVCEVLHRPYGHNVEEFNIIVFQASEKDKPSISSEVVKHLLKTTTGMFL
jgi:hypothetical protein